ncbi:hypothetical protein P691DRAFT_717096 [Macrolepiota fuliginosa MF-IS2]|uniref:Nudix hydrolase domain-containing protein n=1 Tax=Macrolepiota fuliginosa MF-IS2 TaxID=1400762 RepID=A0A9P5XN84_9AGAR|nr:hypothetical protein P691DRAFT_717096 [Macrolepiota fuliginosa MF-IS2]
MASSSNSSARKQYAQYLQFSSDNFLLAAGGVLFRLAPPPDTGIDNLQICVLHHRKTNDILLPKGRKDVGEPIEQAALRETFEETGYACEPLPCPMLTRAPNPNLDTSLRPHVELESTEPFTITVKMLKDGSMKVILWYLMRMVSNSAPMVQGTQMANEDFESMWVGARDAARILTRPDYRNVAKLAAELVENGMTMSDHRPAFNP